MFSHVPRYACVALALAIALAPMRVHAQEDQERSLLKQSHIYKEYEWVEERAGDCHMSGILTIFDNGYAIWTASTKTEHSVTGDIWHESLEVLDSSNRRLFGFGVWDSPRMFEGSEYNWRRTATFPRGFYDNAESAASSGEC